MEKNPKANFINLGKILAIHISDKLISDNSIIQKKTMNKMGKRFKVVLNK